MRIIKHISNSIYEHLMTSYMEFRDIKTPGRHILIIESDDWGSIRVPSRQVYDALMSEGYAMDSRPYERYDCLESNNDIDELQDVLLRFTDKNGNHPVITMNYLSANPDFEQIKSGGFKRYYYETINKTYQRREESNAVIDLVKQGIHNGVFLPQCHGREHFNVPFWMDSLQKGDKDVLNAFNYGMCGIFPKANPSEGNKYMATFRVNNEKYLDMYNGIVSESLELFREIWGFSSKSFIAPCYTWHDEMEKILYQGGVRIIQGERKQRDSIKNRHIFHYQGQQNSNGQIYSVRNCSFEPATDKTFSLEKAVNEVSSAFERNRLAVVSSHRINYVGGIDILNRKRNLQLLESYIRDISNKYPDVEFLSSDSIVSMIGV